MADYEHKSTQQVNVNFGETFNMTKKSPAIAKRIFDTLKNAMAYVDNPKDTAIAGLILSVIQDKNDENNGIYQVRVLQTSKDKLRLVKIGNNTKPSYEIGEGLAIEKGKQETDKDFLTVKFDDTPSNGVGVTTDYISKSDKGLKLNVQTIENITSNESKTFLLDAKNAKAYIDNMDAGTYNLKK